METSRRQISLGFTGTRGTAEMTWALRGKQVFWNLWNMKRGLPIFIEPEEFLLSFRERFGG
ncbi:MAG: hypothetical protein ABIK92_03410 [Pseudomonadota bacterium]